MSKETKQIKIADYILSKELTNEHSGFAKWGFAKKDKKDYFIKEFLSPIWPDESSPLSEEQKQSKIGECIEWVERKSAVYEAIENSSNGNIIVPIDFFRHGSHYYLVTEKVDTCSLSIDQVSSLDIEKKLIILKVFAHCLSQLGKSGIVHSDLKPENLLIKETVAGMYTVKLIDFDSSYLETDLPSSDEIQCDPTYMSPEAFLYMIEEASVLNHRSDIFSAGLIFHQYLCGELPKISDDYDYIYEAVLDDAEVVIHDSIPLRMKQIITMMLTKDPSERLNSENMYQLMLLTTQQNIYGTTITSTAEAITRKNTFRPSTDNEW